MTKLSQVLTVSVVILSIIELIAPRTLTLNPRTDSSQYVHKPVKQRYHLRSSLALAFPFWTVWTSSLIEVMLFKLVWVLPVVFVSLSMLEALWTAREILQYIGFSIGVAGGLVALVSFLCYHLLGSSAAVSTGGGCVAIVLTLLIGFRHAFPFKEVLNLNRVLPAAVHEFLPARGLIQARHLPFLCLSSELVLAVAFPSWFSDWPIGIVAYFSAWFYIRYLMHFPYANVRGDHSSEFTLSLLFPKWLRPSIDRLSAMVYPVAVMATGGWLELRVTDKISVAIASSLYSPTDAAAASSVIEVLAAGTAEERAKFEERRAKALKFLDDNITALVGRKGPTDDIMRLVEGSPRHIGGMTAEEIAEV